MRRAAVVLAICWAAAVLWAAAGRSRWQAGPRHPGPGRDGTAVATPPAGRPSPLDAARRQAGADSGASRIGPGGDLSGCRPEPVSVTWLGPNRADVELDCSAVLALAGGVEVPVARTWRIAVVWQHDGWVAAGPR